MALKKYIADALTFSRVPLGLLTAWAIVLRMWPIATILFIAVILTDAFDGMAARRWPYPAGMSHWWSLDGHRYDNTMDAIMMATVIIGLAVRLPIWWLILAIIVVGTIVLLRTIAYVRTFNPALAEKIDVAHGWMFVSILVAMLVNMTVLATSHWPFWIGIYAGVGAFMLYIKRDRAVSRPETR